MKNVAAVQTDSQLITHFCEGATKPALNRRPAEWETIAAKLCQHVEILDKMNGKGVIFADFKLPYRKAENVIAYYALVLDIEPQRDNGQWQLPPQPDEIVERLEGCELAGVIYTSHSHMVEPHILKPKNPTKTAKGARYRVIVPLQQPIVTDIENNLKHHTLELAGKLGLLEYLDSASFAVSQFFFMPAHRPTYPKYAAAVVGQAWDIDQALTPLTELEAGLPIGDSKPKPQASLVAITPSTESHATPMSTAGGFDAVKRAAQHHWSAILPRLGISSTA